MLECPPRYRDDPQRGADPGQNSYGECHYEGASVTMRGSPSFSAHGTCFPPPLQFVVLELSSNWNVSVMTGAAAAT